jgi:hypothetical protein
MQERAEFEATSPDEGSGHTPPPPQYGQRVPQDPAAAGNSPGFQNAETPDFQSYGEYHQAGIPGGTVPAPQPAKEDLVRGTLFSLVAIPAGVILWLILWNMGFIASIVGFLVAAGAARMYVLGSGGSLSRRGVWVIAGVTLATVLVSFLGSIWVDIASAMKVSPLAQLVDPQAWDLFVLNVTGNPEFLELYAGDFAMALLFSALGCFFTLRRLFSQTRNVAP